MRDLLDRILDVIPHSGQGMARALANSFCLSADNAHATHPNFPEKSDPASPIRLGGGVVLKYNATQKYSTTAYSGAVFGEICRMAGVPVQRFANRADVPGGSTLGNLRPTRCLCPRRDIACPAGHALGGGDGSLCRRRRHAQGGGGLLPRHHPPPWATAAACWSRRPASE